MPNSSFHFISYSLAFIGISLGAFIAAMNHLIVQPLNAQTANESSFDADISLRLEALAVDPISRTITIDWYPEFAEVDCTKDPVVTDIVISQSLLDTTSPSWTPQPPYLPLYTLNTTEYCFDLINTAFPISFRTVTKLLPSNEPILLDFSRLSLQSYPFDVYTAPFQFNTHNVVTGAIGAPNITAAFGVVVNFEITLQTSSLNHNQIGNINTSNLRLTFQIKRSRATKMFVILVAVTNWVTSVVFLIMSAATLVYKPHEIYSEMFVLPISAMFAFTSVRANFPGAPDGFGTTLDMYSILPCLMIMTFCSSLLLLIILYRRIQEKAPLTTLKTPNVDIEKNHSGVKDLGVLLSIYKRNIVIECL